MEPRKNEAFDIERRNPLHFTIGLVIALSFVLIAFEWKSEIDPIVFDPAEDIFDDPYLPPITRIEEPEPPKPKPIIKPKAEAPKPHPNPNFVETKEPESVKSEPIDSDVPDIIEDIVVTGPPIETVVEPFIIVESMPEFKGGDKAFLKYLAKETKYPKQAERMRAESTVYVEFVINEDGSISDIKILKGGGYGFDEEVIRVLLNSPKWEPGKQRGRAVRVKKYIPMKFYFK